MPGIFIIDGGVSAAADLLLDPAREAYRRQLPGRGYRPEARIMAAVLGNDAGVVGAADLARHHDGAVTGVPSSALESAPALTAVVHESESRRSRLWWRRRHTG